MTTQATATSAPNWAARNRGMPTPDLDRIAADERLPQVVIGAAQADEPSRSAEFTN
jgi:hypothetical protein